jgi:hypothetical protein
VVTIANKKVLEDICQDECDGRYCILKEIALSSQCDRTLIQLKCIEKYKFELSEREGKDVGWNNATMSWVDTGRAKLFGDYYQEGMNYRNLYKRINKEVIEQ